MNHLVVLSHHSVAVVTHHPVVLVDFGLLVVPVDSGRPVVPAGSVAALGSVELAAPAVPVVVAVADCMLVVVGRYNHTDYYWYTDSDSVVVAADRNRRNFVAAVAHLRNIRIDLMRRRRGIQNLTCNIYYVKTIYTKQTQIITLLSLIILVSVVILSILLLTIIIINVIHSILLSPITHLLLPQLLWLLLCQILLLLSHHVLLLLC